MGNTSEKVAVTVTPDTARAKIQRNKRIADRKKKKIDKEDYSRMMRELHDCAQRVNDWDSVTNQIFCDMTVWRNDKYEGVRDLPAYAYVVKTLRTQGFTVKEDYRTIEHAGVTMTQLTITCPPE